MTMTKQTTAVRNAAIKLALSTLQKAGLRTDYSLDLISQEVGISPARIRSYLSTDKEAAALAGAAAEKFPECGNTNNTK